jgi:hypothetical protein
MIGINNSTIYRYRINLDGIYKKFRNEYLKLIWWMAKLVCLWQLRIKVMILQAYEF